MLHIQGEYQGLAVLFLVFQIMVYYELVTLGGFRHLLNYRWRQFPIAPDQLFLIHINLWLKVYLGLNLLELWLGENLVKYQLLHGNIINYILIKEFIEQLAFLVCASYRGSSKSQQLNIPLLLANSLHNPLIGLGDRVMCLINYYNHLAGQDRIKVIKVAEPGLDADYYYIIPFIRHSYTAVLPRYAGQSKGFCLWIYLRNKAAIIYKSICCLVYQHVTVGEPDYLISICYHMLQQKIGGGASLSAASRHYQQSGSMIVRNKILTEAVNCLLLKIVKRYFPAGGFP